MLGPLTSFDVLTGRIGCGVRELVATQASSELLYTYSVERICVGTSNSETRFRECGMVVCGLSLSCWARVQCIWT